MRKSNKLNPHNNYKNTLDITKVVGSLVNVRPRDIEHILMLSYLALLHKLSNTVLDSDIKLEELEFEVPYLGCLTIHIDKDNKLTFRSLDPEDELVSDIIETIKSGDSKLIAEAKKSVGKRITQKYNELL